jgi:hypothetical protein
MVISLNPVQLKARCRMANRPIHEIRLGKVKAAIWRNETEAGVRYSVAIVRIFRTDTGWESSPSFGRDELPLVAKVADRVHSWIYEQNDRSDSASESPEPAAATVSTPQPGRQRAVNR